MKRLLSVCVSIWAILDASHGISTKMDFDDASTSTNSTDDDVEVKHTIVVSTKLKNNRRGLHSNDGDTGTLTYNIGRKESKKDDSGEVPILTGYKAVETTQIRTPDSRNKPQIPLHRVLQSPQSYPDSVFINRNIRDDYDIYPNVALNPSQWKPSTLFNNINWWSQESRDSNFLRSNRPESFIRSGRPAYPNQVKLQRKITDDGIKEFYCRKCREMSNDDKDCLGRTVYQNPQQRGWVTTTPKMKIDGKLAKLN